MAKAQQKTSSSELYPEEEAVVQRTLSGKEKLYKFDSPDDAIKHLHKLSKKK